MNMSRAIDVIRQTPSHTRDILVAVLEGETWLFEPRDIRVGALPYLDVPRVFSEESQDVRAAVTKALQSLIYQLVHEATSQLSDVAMSNLLVVLQKCGEGLLGSLKEVVESDLLVKQGRLSLHASLLKAIASHRHRLPVSFWIDQSRRIGSQFGAMIFSSIAMIDLDAAFFHLPELVTDKETAMKWVKFIPLLAPPHLKEKIAPIWGRLDKSVQEVLKSYSSIYPQLAVTASGGWESEFPGFVSGALSLIHQMGKGAEQMLQGVRYGAHCVLNPPTVPLESISSYPKVIGPGPSEFALAS